MNWSYTLTSIFCQLVFRVTIVGGLQIAMETNSPARIVEPTITDVSSYISIHTYFHTRAFSPRLPISFPILQAASIATNVGANPSAISINELMKSTIISQIKGGLILILLDPACDISHDKVCDKNYN
jgi:hypothetical protein